MLRRIQTSRYICWSAHPLSAAGLRDMTHPKEKERVSHVIAQKTKLEELPESILNQARNALVLLRIPRSLKGFRYLTIATVLVVLVPERLERITKEIYPEVARRCGTKSSRVERCMRKAINHFWEAGNREALDQMAGYHLDKRPTNTEFIDLVSIYIANS